MEIRGEAGHWRSKPIPVSSGSWLAESMRAAVCMKYMEVCVSVYIINTIIYKQCDYQMSMIACYAFGELALIFSGHHSNISLPSSL